MGDVYQAERILDTKTMRGKRYFLIKWHGWDDSNNTWEPKKNIIDTRLIDVFFKNLKKKTQNLEKTNTSSNDEINSDKKKSKALNQNKKKQTNLDNSNCYEFNDDDLSENENNQIFKSNSKSETKTQKNHSQEDFLRSAIREAEGLRPIVKNTINNHKKSQISRNKVKSSESSDEDVVKNDKNKRSNKTKSVKLVRRRKISSSISSSSSSLIPFKRRLTFANKKSLNKIKYSDDEYEDYQTDEDINESDDTTSTINSKKINNQKVKKSNQVKPKQYVNENKDDIDDSWKRSNKKSEKSDQYFDEKNDTSNRNMGQYRSSVINDENDFDEADSSFEDCSTMITMLTNSDDVFVTDVTSGVVTVTIKECVSRDGFFKKRHPDNDE